MNKCPKCDHEYKTGETECKKCGIIFKKYEALQKQQITKKQSLLMKCKVCDKEISKNAVTCPFCGEPNKIENLIDYSSDKIENSLKKKTHPLLPTSGAALMLVLILLCVFASQKDNSSSSYSKAKPKAAEVKVKKQEPHWTVTNNPRDAFYEIRRYARASLKAPRTAKFSRDYTDSQYIGDHKYKINSYVDSQNSFGAMIRTRFTGEIEQIGKHDWKLISLEFAE